MHARAHAHVRTCVTGREQEWDKARDESARNRHVMHTDTHAHKHTHTHTNTYTLSLSLSLSLSHTHMRTLACAHTHARTCTHMYTQTHTRACDTHTHTHKHTVSRAHTHAHTHTPPSSSSKHAKILRNLGSVESLGWKALTYPTGLGVKILFSLKATHDSRDIEWEIRTSEHEKKWNRI